MNVKANDHSGAETDVESDNGENIDLVLPEDDTSIRSLLVDAMESDDSPDADDEETSTSEDGPESATSDDDDDPQPPQSWTEAERATWEELPQSARDAISRREREYQAGLKSDAELQKVVAPLAERLEGTGVHPDQYFDRLLKAEQFIQQNPLGAVEHLIQQYGLRDQVAAKLGGSPSPGSTSTGTPSKAQSPQESDRIARLEQEVRYNAELAAATAEWEAFKKDNPDAVGLREVMAAKMGANPRLSYADAYKEAKELVTTVAGSSARDDEAARIAAATASAGKGKRLELPRGRSTATGRSNESTGNLRDDIANAMREAGGR